MKYKSKIIILFIILISFINSSYARENKILVKINNEIITTVDILNEIKFLSILNEEFKNIEKNQQIKIAKNSLIKEKIKSIEILKFTNNLNIEDRIFSQIVKNYFGNQKTKNLEEYENFFEENDLNIEFIRKKISIDTLWKRLIFEKFHKNVKIDENEIKNNILQKEKQSEYMLSEIVFALDNNEQLYEKLNKISKMIEEKNFAEAALNYSISDTSSSGGKLGWIKENVLSKKIRNELKDLEVGQFTNPIVIPGGFLILHKENSRKFKVDLDINNEIKNIIDKKTNDQLNKLSNIYLNKLKKNIQINEI